MANTVWRRGVDFKRLSTEIRADAGASMISDTQLPGRTSRICDATGKSFGRIVDFKDQFSDWLHGRYEIRRGNYRFHGWELIDPPRARRAPRDLQNRQLNLFE